MTRDNPFGISAVYRCVVHPGKDEPEFGCDITRGPILAATAWGDSEHEARSRALDIMRLLSIPRMVPPRFVFEPRAA